MNLFSLGERARLAGAVLLALITVSTFAQAPDPASTVPSVSTELLIKFKPGTDVGAFARQRGVTIKSQLLSDPEMYVLKAGSEAMAQEEMRAYAALGAVGASYYNLPALEERMAFVPNDPFFSSGNPTGFPGQWHLVWPANPGLDSNVQGAWNRDLTGLGVTVGICDDGVEAAHPDLAPNYVAADSYDFVDLNPDPNPVLTDDNHGTSVAGVTAARGGNGIGLTGAAPFARIAGMRLSFSGAGTTASFVDVIKYRSFGPTRAVKVKNHSYGVSVIWVPNQAQRDALADSAAAGTIHLLAAANDRGKTTTQQGFVITADSNKVAFQSSPHVITVAALASSGRFASYSNYGANVFVTAPSSSFRTGEFGGDGVTGITTTDRSAGVGYNPGDRNLPYADRAYTPDFGGTSSATPLVAGIMALGVQANPNLTVRMAKHLLARTSDVVDATDSTAESDAGWRLNAAGFRFNPNYGFGLIDADEFTRLATQFSGVTPVVISETPTLAIGAAIPDNGQISRQFNTTSTTPVEEMEIYLNITHPFRGHVEAFLTSPQGTTSRLFIRNGLDLNRSGEPGIDWWFTSNAFWGENPAGNWTLTVHDRFAGQVGTWNSYRARLRLGALIPVGGAAAPTIASFVPTSGPPGTSVTITGTKFTGATSVLFSGVNAAAFTIDSDTQIRATVPTGAATGPISIANPAGTVASATDFQVTGGPAITGFTPTGGAVGTSVVITGAAFTGVTRVTFDLVNATFTVNSSTQITAIATGAGNGRIAVTTAAGTATSGGVFTVTTRPLISSFSPTTGPAGTLVTITGANFTGTTAVSFNPNLNAAFTVNSATQITATVPVGVVTGSISVTTPAGTANSAGVFFRAAPPFITDFTPRIGPPGTAVTIHGSNFTAARAVRFNSVDATFTVISSSQIAATVPPGATTGRITVATPPGTATSGVDFTVATGPTNDNFAASQAVSGNAGTATGTNVGASKESGEPAHSGNGGGKSVWYRWTAPSTGTWVFDTFGSGFDTLLAVYTGGAVGSLTPIASNDDAGVAGETQSRVTINATGGTVYRIAVDGFNSQGGNALQAAPGNVVLNWAAVLAPPTIVGFTPASGTVGTSVLIDGTNFLGATAVRFNGTAALNVLVLSASGIEAVVPAGATSGPITVTSAAGTGTSAASFAVLTGPGNDAFANAELITGNAGTVAGSNVGATKETEEPSHAGNPGGKSIWYRWTAPSGGTWSFDTQGSTFDTLLAIYTGSSVAGLSLIAENDDSLDLAGRTSKVTFPAVSGTTYRIAIDGYVGGSGGVQLNWTRLPETPQITSFTPESGSPGTLVTIVGANFGGASQVRFNGANAASFAVVSATQITAIVPAGATSGPITVTTGFGTATSASSFIVFTASNDQFANASVMTGPAWITMGSTVAATKETGEPDHADNAGGKSIWFRWTAPSTGTWTLETTGSDFDTLLGVYTGTAVSALTVIASDDDGGPNMTSLATFNAVSGTTYRMAVDGFVGISGSVVLKLLPASPPITLYSTGFEPAEGFTADFTVSGQGGWTNQGSGGNGIVSNFIPGLGQQAYIGFTPPTTFGDRLLLWHPINHTPVLASRPVVRFSVLMKIVDSTTSDYDDFHWTVYNVSGQRLFRLDFDNSNLSIYHQGSGSFVDSAVTYENGQNYQLEVVMDFAKNLWSAALEGVPIVTALPITTTGQALNLGDIDAEWFPQDDSALGDNYMLFDNYRVTAEAGESPVIHVSPASQTVAGGAAVTFSVVAGGADTLTYQWQRNGTEIAGATSALFTISNAAASHAGTYSVVTTNAAGSATSVGATLAVNALVAPSIAPHPASQTVVEGATATFSVGANGTAPLAYQWYRSGLIISGATASTLTLNNLTVSQSGAYTATVSNSAGTATSVAATLTVQLRDTDGDSLPDFFETANGLDPNNPNDAALDHDGDGSTNRAEFLAGTDPRNSSSRLQFVGSEIQGANVHLFFTSQLGKKYQLQKSSNLSAWTSLGAPVPGTGGVVEVVALGEAGAGAGARFFRAMIVD